MIRCLSLVGLWVFVSERYPSVVGATIPLCIQHFDVFISKAFAEGYDVLLSKHPTEAEYIVDEIKWIVEDNFEDFLALHPNYYHFSYLAKLVLERLLSDVFSVDDDIKKEMDGLLQEITDNISSANDDLLAHETITAFADRWFMGINHIKQRLEGEMFDLTPLILKAANNPFTLDETTLFAEQFAHSIEGHIDWDDEDWIDILTTDVFCRVRVNFNLILATPALSDDALQFARSWGVTVFAASDFDDAIYRIDLSTAETVFGKHVPEILDVRAFSLNELWFATL